MQMTVVPDATDTLGEGLTVTDTASVAEHPFASVTITEYMVVDAGLATGLEIVVLLKPVEGLQLYVTPPDAESVVLVPLQMLTSDPAFAEESE